MSLIYNMSVSMCVLLWWICSGVLCPGATVTAAVTVSDRATITTAATSDTTTSTIDTAIDAASAVTTDTNGTSDTTINAVASATTAVSVRARSASLPASEDLRGSEGTSETENQAGVSLDQVLDAVVDLVDTISSSAINRHLAELKEQLRELNAGVRHDSQMASDTSAAVQRLLNSQTRLEDIQQELQQLLTEEARKKTEFATLQQSHAQLQANLTQLRTEQARIVDILESIRQHQQTSSCPIGWSRSCTSCFIIPTQAANWSEANLICARLHPRATLASIHPDSAHHVRRLFQEADFNSFWIGLKRQNSGPGWLWADGTALDYTNWMDGEPNNAGGTEDCVQSRDPANNEYRWNDLECSYQLKFLCQIRAPLM